MNKKNLYILLALAAVIILGFVWRYESKAPETNQQSQTENNSGNSNPETTINQSKESQIKVWEGTLQTSNNPAKGNLMLKTDKTVIYINTSRDYSELIGKAVLVNYEGNLDSFVLGDIVAK